MPTTLASRPRTQLAALAGAFLALLIPRLALAHTGVGPANGLASGFFHPLGGLDHVCAMISVGLWASQQKDRRAVWAVPLAFVSVMTAGAALGAAGVALPFAERGIVLSVLLLGVLVAAAARLPLAASVFVVALFAVCHGHVHGSEMPATVSGVGYGAGFVLATALLHAAGVGVGVATQKLSRPVVVRAAGAAVAACGVLLWLV